jgi:hypothetical protein
VAIAFYVNVYLKLRNLAAKELVTSLILFFPGRPKPKSCLGLVFNFKLGCFVVVLALLYGAYSRPHLELKI